MILSRRNRRRQQLAKLWVATLMILCPLVAVAGGLLPIMFGQQGRREIVSDDFTRPRPTPTPKHKAIVGKIMDFPTALATPTPPKRYRLVASPLANTAPLAGNVEQLGVTLWRLRPAGKVEIGERLIVKEKGKSSEWIPERIEIDTSLRNNDRVRLSIESAREGYLYVIGRDLYADGTMGDARVIFPRRSIRVGDNQVRPGMLIDLPGQEDSPNYFTVRSSRSSLGSNQVGEILTIIVSASPLDLSNQPLHISAAEMAKWEKARGESERFEMVGGAGQAWTKEEKQAASAQGWRQLTQADPSPQTIYRIAATNKTAFLVNVQLSYAK